MSLKSTLLMLLWVIPSIHFGQDLVFHANNGNVSFVSDAPLETIKASSHYLRGVVDVQKNEFAFTISIETFEGFNSPLQKIHFNENYMESNLFPNATFTGKFIEQLDFSKTGIYQVRAKGFFFIHGTRKERIIKGKLRIGSDFVSIESSFSVTLEEHDITIPKIVKQKISEKITVNVDIEMPIAND